MTFWTLYFPKFITVTCKTVVIRTWIFGFGFANHNFVSYVLISGYYVNAPPQRNMTGSPMKITQPIQPRNDGMRPQIQSGQPMIVRQGSMEAIQLSQPGNVIMQQQPSHIVQSGNQFVRTNVGQNSVRPARPTFMRAQDMGGQRILRPVENQGAYVLRGAYSVPSSSAEQFQVQNVQQAYIQQGRFTDLFIRNYKILF